VLEGAFAGWLDLLRQRNRPRRADTHPVWHPILTKGFANGGTRGETGPRTIRAVVFAASKLSLHGRGRGVRHAGIYEDPGEESGRAQIRCAAPSSASRSPRSPAWSLPGGINWLGPRAGAVGRPRSRTSSGRTARQAVRGLSPARQGPRPARKPWWPSNITGPLTEVAHPLGPPAGGAPDYERPAAHPPPACRWP